MTALGELTLEDAAKEAAGNWQRFESFVWFRDSEIADPDNWAIIYTHNRDSGLLDQSNADAIAEAMEPFTNGDDPDVVLGVPRPLGGRSRRWLLHQGLPGR